MGLGGGGGQVNIQEVKRTQSDTGVNQGPKPGVTRIFSVMWFYVWCCRLKRRQEEGQSEAAREDANGDREAEAAATDEDAPEPEPEPEPESSSKLSMCGSVCSSPGSC